MSEAARSDLYTGLSEVTGADRAETLMRAIPLHDLDEVATKADIAMVRSEIAEAQSELKTEIAELRAELKTDIAALRTSLTGWMLTLLVAIIGAMASIGFMT